MPLPFLAAAAACVRLACCTLPVLLLTAAEVCHASPPPNSVLVNLHPKVAHLGTSSSALAIDRNGVVMGEALRIQRTGGPPVVIGYASDGATIFAPNFGSATTIRRGFLWDSKTDVVTDLGVWETPLPFNRHAVAPLGANRSGAHVGKAAVRGVDHAVFYSAPKAAAFDLNEASFADSDWVLREATDLNDLSMIVGRGSYRGSSCAFVLLPSRLAQPQYRVTELAPIVSSAWGDDISVHAITDSGLVVGNTTVWTGFGYDTHAFRFDGIALKDAGKGFVQAVNSRGDLAGYTVANNVPTGFVRQEWETPESGGVADGTARFFFAINSSGQIAGATQQADWRYRAFLLSPTGELEHIDVPASGETIPNAINEAGAIAGKYLRGNGASYGAFFYSDGKAIELPTLGGVGSTASGLNDAGVVVGSSQTASGVRHAFVYHNGGLQDLGSLGGGAFASSASAVNNAGVIVGASGSASGNRAVIWRDGKLTDLNDFLPASSGWVLESAIALNNAGEIVGSGMYQGKKRGYVLAPVRLERSEVARLERAFREAADDHTRAQVLRRFEAIHSSDAVAAIGRLFAEQSADDIKADLLSAVGDMAAGNENACLAVLKLGLASSQSSGVRVAAAEECWALSVQSVSPLLLPLLQDPDEDIRDAAESALSRRVPQADPEEAWLDDTGVAVAASAGPWMDTKRAPLILFYDGWREFIEPLVAKRPGLVVLMKKDFGKSQPPRPDGTIPYEFKGRPSWISGDLRKNGLRCGLRISGNRAGDALDTGTSSLMGKFKNGRWTVKQVKSYLEDALSGPRRYDFIVIDELSEASWWRQQRRWDGKPNEARAMQFDRLLRLMATDPRRGSFDPLDGVRRVIGCVSIALTQNDKAPNPPGSEPQSADLADDQMKSLKWPLRSLFANGRAIALEVYVRPQDTPLFRKDAHTATLRLEQAMNAKTPAPGSRPHTRGHRFTVNEINEKTITMVGFSREYTALRTGSIERALRLQLDVLKKHPVLRRQRGVGFFFVTGDDLPSDDPNRDDIMRAIDEKVTGRWRVP